jgi:transposase-like protein
VWKGSGGVTKQVEHDGARDALARFADELSAHAYIEKLLWPNGCICPRCGTSGRIGRLNGSSTRIGTFKCYACRKSFSVTMGTLFESSHVPVHKWLQAMYLTDCGATPIRPHHLQRILNVSFKTAAAMMRRLSEAAAQAHLVEVKTPGLFSSDRHRSSADGAGDH